jgi:hypothetical protein
MLTPYSAISYLITHLHWRIGFLQKKTSSELLTRRICLVKLRCQARAYLVSLACPGNLENNGVFRKRDILFLNENHRCRQNKENLRELLEFTFRSSLILEAD